MILRDSMIEHLPHQFPIRLVDTIVHYEEKVMLVGQVNPFEHRRWYGDLEWIPPVFLIEGMAQTASIYIQLETEPLDEWEIPVLGSVRSTGHLRTDWSGLLYWKVVPLRIAQRNAVMEGWALDEEENQLISAQLSLSVVDWTAKRRAEPGERIRERE